MNKKRLIAFFLLAFVAQCLGSISFPMMHLIYFAPFLACYLILRPLLSSLWASLGCGALCDLLSSGLPFGSFAAIFTLTTLLLHNQKRHFYEDNAVSFSLYTLLYSSIIGVLHLSLLKVLQPTFSMGGYSMVTNIIFMPVIDGIYSIFWFLLPLNIYRKLRRYIIQKRYNP